MDADEPCFVESVTDYWGTYEQRWMVPPPGDGVKFRVTKDEWTDDWDVRVIREWSAT
jgi:hypothetical protein